MKRRTLLSAWAIPFLPTFAHGPALADEVHIDIPLRFATLGDETAPQQIGIVVKNVADADRQISTVLLHGLQDLGLSIEAPPLDLNDFIAAKVEWRTSRRELGNDLIAAHNASKLGGNLPGKRIYAVQYLGRYLYNGPTLRIVLAVSLFERSRFGKFRHSTATYSGQFFANQLERAIIRRLADAAHK